jgi:hypothetical protein
VVAIARDHETANASLSIALEPNAPVLCLEHVAA